jgi:hypothetical protein
MKITHTNDSYLSGGGRVKFNKKFDYCLFRQDFGGTESIHFNIAEIPDINEMINTGEITIHPSYSIVFCRTKTLLKDISTDNGFGCYATLYKK